MTCPRCDTRSYIYNGDCVGCRTRHTARLPVKLIRQIVAAHPDMRDAIKEHYLLDKMEIKNGVHDSECE